MDLYASDDEMLPARGRALVGTGLKMAFPKGTYGRIAPRSGLALHHGIDVGGGVIDGDYRGEIRAILFNHTDVPFKIKKGDRIAQIICECVKLPSLVTVASLDQTERGEGGFGSSGKAG